MRKYPAVYLLTIALILALSTVATAQQDKSKRPSPPAQAKCQFDDGKSITVDYSSPRIKGRKIYGGLVPFNQVWRTGANDATSFVTTADLTVGGATVPTGSYTLFTLPSEDTWKLIISKKTGEWGIPYPGESNDLVRVDMQKQALPSPVENFTIAFDKTGPDACAMHFDWETTRVSVNVAEKK
jgi:hypothetical protein